MFAAAMHAQRAIERNFEPISYHPTSEARRLINMGIKHDLQAQALRPNVPIPPRRHTLKYLGVMRRETGSLTDNAKVVVRPGDLKAGTDLFSHFGFKWPQRDRTLAFNRAFNAWTDEVRARLQSAKG